MLRPVLPKYVKTASFRLAGLYVMIFAASALVLGVAVFISARSILDQQMTARILTEAEFLHAEYRSGGLERLTAIVKLRSRGPNALDYFVQDQTGARLAGDMPAAVGMPKPGWITMQVPQGAEDDGLPEEVHAYVSDLGNGLTLAVGDDLGRIDELQESIATAFVWTIGLAAILGIGGGIFLSHAFLARVDAISRTAEAIISGDLTHRVALRGTGDDLDRLALTLNRMLDRICTLMESLRQVSTDVAHDLRTPLSRLFHSLEEARTHARSIVDYEVAVNAAMREAESLLQIFSALLRIAQVEGSSSRAGFRTVDLSAVVEAITDAYQPDAEDSGRHLAADVEPGAHIHGDQELLTQAIANLVENALHHTPVGTRIRLSLTHAPHQKLRLCVEDNGPGAAVRDLDQLTHRFFRAESSRTTPGNGLGLSLVAAVAELHGAKLELASSSSGFRAILLLEALRP